VSEEKADEKVSELQLGIRELFRILIPGAYLVGLLHLFAPDSAIVRLSEKGTIYLLVVALFLGLVGYALRLHERCFPYFLSFENSRRKLNDVIVMTISDKTQRDNVDVYKYFLETSGSPIRDRVHYFSSFYYMLVEMSFISVGTSVYLITSRVFAVAALRCGTLAECAVGLILLACAIQISLLLGLRGIRRTWLKAVSLGPLVLIGFGLVLLGLLAGWQGLKESIAKDYSVPCFLLLGFAFERLGAKHWQQIISEQVVFVSHRDDYMQEIKAKLNGRLGDS